jgi:hypothetical protein
MLIEPMLEENFENRSLLLLLFNGVCWWYDNDKKWDFDTILIIMSNVALEFLAM